MFDPMNGQFQINPQITQAQLNSLISKNNNTITLTDIQNNTYPVKVSIPRNMLPSTTPVPSVTADISTYNKALLQAQVINGAVNEIASK